MSTVHGADVMINTYIFLYQQCSVCELQAKRDSKLCFWGLCSLHFLDQTQRCETLLKNDRIPPAFGLP